MSESRTEKGQAWRFKPDGFYVDQYAKSMAMMFSDNPCGYSDDDYDQYEAKFLTDLAAHDDELLAPIRALKVPELLDALAEILSHLVMDTPKDQELTDRYVTMLQNAATNLRPLISMTREDQR